ncbi:MULTISPECIES: hypothetical protein [Actinomadura]|uniref:Uncharacterized protein n=1 Tax=Actinomadura yumaensis TaxID=111807 RepID=A0ABW2CES4_9ACTN|nr:hypothetical protein [Actinomadura sp. J1-007]MWK34534.1 hypothetical protein [Actinomadura sp. J1-007]
MAALAAGVVLGTGSLAACMADDDNPNSVSGPATDGFDAYMRSCLTPNAGYLVKCSSWKAYWKALGSVHPGRRPSGVEDELQKVGPGSAPCDERPGATDWFWHDMARETHQPKPSYRWRIICMKRTGKPGSKT